MSAKFLFIAGLVPFIAAGAPVAPTAPAATAMQFENRQDPAQKDLQDKMFRAANKKRQQDIRDETNKLFQLATELKAAVDKTDENVLSLEVVRKADEVEKLAKKVKEKMKEAIGPPPNEPTSRPLPTPFPR